MAKVSLVSLGCPKNLVDSEGALGEVVQAGHELITDQSRADVIIVNTCGFIESARAESVEAILGALECKESGSCKAVVVIGCLAQRFAEDLAQELPGVDAFLGVGHAGKIAEAIDKALAGRRLIDRSAAPKEWVEQSARIQSTPPWTAYTQISDGCNNRCAYCAIPDIRGQFRSRPESLIVDEAKRLADDGVKELILVGQDVTQYGMDIGKPNSLPGLLEKLAEIESLKWIRLMYCYPSKVTPELINAVASIDKVVKYMDLPLQHGDESVLKAMNRRGSSEDSLRVIDSIREKCPEIALRTTFIVGFPGETDAAFENLLAFTERISFDRVGVFTYSPEEGTPAAKLEKRVSEKTAMERYERLMRLQQGISLERNRSFIGKSMEILVEGPAEDSMYGRSYRDAPEIDGVVFLPGSKAKPGELVNVKIAQATEYDLISESHKLRKPKGSRAG